MWVALAFITAVGTSLQDIFGRKALDRTDFYIVAWAWTACTLPFLAVALFIDGFPQILPSFWPAVLASTIILSISSLLFFRAIQIADLSLTVPMLAFTPMLLLISSPLMLGEFPQPLGVVGILLIVLGSYVLNFAQRHHGFFEPFYYLLKNRGPRMMLTVAVLFSIGANVDKIGMLNSSPIMWVFSINFFVTIVLSVIVGIKVRMPVAAFKSAWKFLLLMGLVTSIALITQMYALRLTIVPYVIAIKRTSVVMTALIGLFILKEQSFKERLTGVILMVAGVFIISFLSN